MKNPEEDVLFFERPEDFRKWLLKNHEKADLLWVGYYKKNSGLPSIDWPQSVAQALCFGWIDGIRKSIDDKSYKIRFTPRRKNSHWSDVNLKMVKELIAQKKMHPAGIAAYKRRKKGNMRKASYEQQEVKLLKKYEDQIRKYKPAWEFFENGLSPSVRKISVHWVMSAKREETQKRRLQTLIESCCEKRKIPALRRKGE